MQDNEPSLSVAWDALTGYQRTAAVKAALELDLFTHIAAGAQTLEELAARANAAPRGIVALLNYLAADGLLGKSGDRFSLNPTAAAFFDRNAPSYIGSAATFIASPMITGSFAQLTEAVRRGGTAVADDGTLAPEHPVWVEFARAMAPLAGLSAMLLGNLLDIDKLPGGKVLDIAAGHGLFGITLGRLNPNLEVTAQDWRNVLAVAQENAAAAGLGERFRMLPGSAFEVPFESDYSLILLPNFLHHFDPPTCEQILAKCHAALAANGRLVIVEFIPNEDRSAPPEAVKFALVMLASTPAGDAYTFGEYQKMLTHAGFKRAALHDLMPSPARVVIAER